MFHLASQKARISSSKTDTLGARFNVHTVINRGLFYEITDNIALSLGLERRHEFRRHAEEQQKYAVGKSILCSTVIEHSSQISEEVRKRRS